MKIYIIDSLIVVVFFLFLWSCTKDDEFQPVPPKPVNKDFIIAGYVPYYSFSKFNLEALKKLRRIYYFSVSPDDSGKFVYTSADLLNLQTLKNNFSGNGKEIFLVIGGWYESETMHDMAKDLIKRQKYVKDICQFCITHQLQGVDLDWESYPIPVNEANFLSFIQELSAELHPKNLKLTVAVDVSQAALTMRFINYTDQVNLMAYGILDPNGNHATLSMLSAWLSSFRQSGIPFNKIIAGVPFYAKRPKISGDTSPTSIVYRSIPEPYLQDAAATRYGNYSFNSRNMMKDKTIYLMENLCAGIMSWELTQDFAPGSEYSLLKAIYDEYGKLLNP